MLTVTDVAAAADAEEEDDDVDEYKAEDKVEDQVEVAVELAVVEFPLPPLVPVLELVLLRLPWPDPELLGMMIPAATPVSGDCAACTPAAASLYAANVLGPLVGALMTIVIPDWQCCPWLQYNQIGSVVLTTMLNIVSASPCEVGIKSE